MYKLFTWALCIITTEVFCSKLHAQPKELTNISMAQKYFSEHILELDPIEGIYDVENIVEVGVSGYGAQTIKQNLTWIILDVNKIDYGNERGFHSDYGFVVYSISGRPTGLIGGINKLSVPYYTLHSVNANGGEKKITFSLENGVMFKSSDRTYRGNAVSVTNMTAIKSFPTSKMYQDAIYAEEHQREEVSKPTTWTGTGFALTNNYIVTNYHVVENANRISIQGINGDFNHKYSADVVTTDKHNDLAIIKVKGVNISSVSIPYAVKTGTSEVGEEVFVLGYPLTSTMGEEVKLTTGVISSKTGFQGDVSIYQISAPIQPGNSGGPLFDSKGNVVGIVSAKHKGAENVGYAIKTSYLKNLMESAVSTNILPQTNKMAGLNLSGKVKLAKNYVYYITCSSRGYSGSSANNHSNSLPEQAPIKRTPIDVNTIIQRILSNMVPVSGGDFIMINFEGTEEKISIPNFSIGRYEITQEEWQAIMKTNPCNSSGQVGPKIPIFNVSWEDCQEFIKRLNNITGKKFRLPTEEEWEYAASGGQESHNYKFSGSNQSDAVAWYSSNCDKKIHNVGEKLQNELGLFDMSGNVKEWCGDIIDNSKIQALRWTPGNSRIIRGGSWLSGSQECGVSVRNFVSPDVRDVGVGFRIAQ